MKVTELLKRLVSLPGDLDVCIDVDDGVRNNYRDAEGVRVVDGADGYRFVVVDTKFVEHLPTNPDAVPKV